MIGVKHRPPVWHFARKRNRAPSSVTLSCGLRREPQGQPGSSQPGSGAGEARRRERRWWCCSAVAASQQRGRAESLSRCPAWLACSARRGIGSRTVTAPKVAPGRVAHRVMPTGLPESSFVAKFPTCRSPGAGSADLVVQVPWHDSISAGSGSRFPGGRQLHTLAMYTCSRDARSSSSVSNSRPAWPTNGMPCLPSWKPGPRLRTSGRRRALHCRPRPGCGCRQGRNAHSSPTAHSRPPLQFLTSRVRIDHGPDLAGRSTHAVHRVLTTQSRCGRGWVQVPGPGSSPCTRAGHCCHRGRQQVRVTVAARSRRRSASTSRDQEPDLSGCLRLLIATPTPRSSGSARPWLPPSNPRRR